MKAYSINPLRLLTLSVLIFATWSCTKEKVQTPAAQQSSVSSDDALAPGENLVDSLVYGTYKITKFVDSGVDNSGEFNGYTFEFQSDNDFVAHKNGVTYNGRWRTNAAQTKMAINITGTAALDDLDGNDWAITKTTDTRIIIQRKGPDKVVFKM